MTSMRDMWRPDRPPWFLLRGMLFQRHCGRFGATMMLPAVDPRTRTAIYVCECAHDAAVTHQLTAADADRAAWGRFDLRMHGHGEALICDRTVRREKFQELVARVSVFGDDLETIKVVFWSEMGAKPSDSTGVLIDDSHR